MTCTIDLERAPRSTRSILANAEAHQFEVIATLAASGHNDLAKRLTRCQLDRQHRHPGRYPWRCRSAGCGACRRNTIRRWWRAFDGWLAGPDTSLAFIPLPGEPITATRRLRKGLRDVRDRAARLDQRWAAVAMSGLASDGLALVLIKHSGIDRADVWSTLRGRWPLVVITDVGTVQPSSAMAVDDAVALAARRRGIEALRIVVLPMVGALSPSEWGDPLPILLS